MKLSYFHGKVVSGMARELFPDNYNTDTRFCKLYFAEQETKCYSFLIRIFDFYQEGAAVSVALLRQSAAKAVS